MKSRFSIGCIVLLLLVFLSCNTQLPDNLASFILFDDVTFDADSEILDFGTREVGGTGSTVSGTVQNLGDVTITVTALALNDTDNYTLTPFDLPFELAPGGEADFSLSFSPVSTGIKEAALDVTFSIDDVEEPVTVNITGAGNEAPEAVFGIDVSGATDYPEVNGFYLRDGDYGLAPKYTKSGTTDYYIYFFANDGWFWGIDDTFEVDPPWYEPPRHGARCYIGAISEMYPTLFPPEVVTMDEAGWLENSEMNGSLTVKTGITRDGGALMSNHHYSDGEDDAETGTTYRWFQSTTTVDGTYAELVGETDSEYAIQIPGDYDTFFKLEVTPVDSNGFAGLPVTSDPYYAEDDGGMPMP